MPIVCAASAAWRQRGTYYFYDDWSMIDHVLHSTPFDGMMRPFNGHLWMLQYWVYRIQVFWFGVNDHLFLSVIFIAALIALHVSLAALLLVVVALAWARAGIEGLNLQSGSRYPAERRDPVDAGDRAAAGRNHPVTLA